MSPLIRRLLRDWRKHYLKGQEQIYNTMVAKNMRLYGGDSMHDMGQRDFSTFYSHNSFSYENDSLKYYFKPEESNLYMWHFVLYIKYTDEEICGMLYIKDLSGDESVQIGSGENSAHDLTTEILNNTHIQQGHGLGNTFVGNSFASTSVANKSFVRKSKFPYCIEDDSVCDTRGHQEENYTYYSGVSSISSSSSTSSSSSDYEILIRLLTPNNNNVIPLNKTFDFTPFIDRKLFDRSKSLNNIIESLWIFLNENIFRNNNSITSNHTSTNNYYRHQAVGSFTKCWNRTVLKDFKNLFPELYGLYYFTEADQIQVQNWTKNYQQEQDSQIKQKHNQEHNKIATIQHQYLGHKHNNNNAHADTYTNLDTNINTRNTASQDSSHRSQYKKNRHSHEFEENHLHETKKRKFNSDDHFF